MSLRPRLWGARPVGCKCGGEGQVEQKHGMGRGGEWDGLDRGKFAPRGLTALGSRGDDARAVGRGGLRLSSRAGPPMGPIFPDGSILGHKEMKHIARRSW